MIERTFPAFDNAALLDGSGAPIIINSNTANGVELAFQPSFTAKIVTIDEEVGDLDAFRVE